MFWIGLATLMMAVTGVGDDTRPFRDWLDAIRGSAREELKDEARQAKVIAIVDDTEALFRTQREAQNEIAKCIEAADRNYESKEADYVRCLETMDQVAIDGIEGLIQVRKELHGITSPAERDAMRKWIAEQ